MSIYGHQAGLFRTSKEEARRLMSPGCWRSSVAKAWLEAKRLKGESMSEDVALSYRWASLRIS